MGDKKWKDLKELGSQCRILSLLTLVVFGFASLALIIVCSAAIGDPPKYSLSKNDGDTTTKDNVSLLLTMTILSILATLSSIFMLVATFTSNMWMTIPYWIMILALIGEYMYQLLYFGFCIGKCEDLKTLKGIKNIHNATSTSAFTRNVVEGGGGNYIVSSMLMLALLFYALIPSFAFFWQCKTKRAEEIKARPKKTSPAAQQPPPPKQDTPPPTTNPPRRSGEARLSTSAISSADTLPTPRSP